MTFGQKIRKLRNEAGLTQKELAEELNVTFQTVSKWESDVNEPDISNIKQLAKIFHCSVEFLFSEDDSDNQKKVDDSETNLVSTAPIEEKEVEKVTPPEILKVAGSSDAIYKETVSGHEKKAFNERQSKKAILIWAIAVGIVAFGIALGVSIVNYDQLGLAFVIVAPLIIGYALLADVYCIFSLTWISDVFLSVSSWSVRFPGIIFSFSLDGIKFLILMKILFWILGLCISVFVFLLALALSALFSMFCFPYYVAKKDSY